MRCPKCVDEQQLASIVVDEVEVDRCPQCEGIWFDKSELGHLLDSQEDRVEPLMQGEDEADKDRVLGACHRDGNKMLRVLSARNNEVVIDSCVACKGIWLDGGEFRRIKEAQPEIRLRELV